MKLVTALLILLSAAAFAQEPTTAELAARLADMQKRLEKLEALCAASSEGNAEVLPPVPAKVMQTIRANAAAIFPDDFRMQKYQIEQQVEAWRKLHGK